MFQLENKLIVVTGGSRGIGAATAELLVGFGARVISISKSIPTVKQDGVIYLKCDVSDSYECGQVFPKIESDFGSVYGIVVNAGINKDKTFAKLDDSNWDDVIQTNLKGAYNSIKYLLPNLFERKSGSVVFLSSIIGEKGNIGQSNYAASKAALIGLMKSLALEGAKNGVRANAVSPGFIETDMISSIPNEIKEKLISSIPLRHSGTPQEKLQGLLLFYPRLLRPVILQAKFCV